MNNQDYKDLVGTVTYNDPNMGMPIIDRVTGSLSGQTLDESYYIKDASKLFIHPTGPDVINSPAHYARGKFEVWDIIEFFKLNYNLGNVCKYILRAGVKTKSPLEDYKKARAYLDREIAILEGRLDVRPK